MGASQDSAQTKVTDNGWKATQWGWGNGDAWGHYNIYNGGSSSVPQNFIIDNDGNVRYAKVGAFTTTGQITTIVDEMI